MSLPLGETCSGSRYPAISQASHEDQDITKVADTARISASVSMAQCQEYCVNGIHICVKDALQTLVTENPALLCKITRLAYERKPVSVKKPALVCKKSR